MRRLFLGVLVLFLCGWLGRAAAGQIEISFMNWSSTEEVMRPILKVIEDFEKENPGLKIKNIPIGVGDIRNQLMVMTMGGNPPDVIQLHGGDAIYVYHADALLPAEELYDKSFTDNLFDEFYQETWTGDVHAGILWGPQTLTFAYNKQILKQLGYEAPPKTLAEMEEMMKKGKDAIPDLIGFQLDTTIRTIGLAHVWSFMNSFEYEVIKGKVSKFNSPAMVEFGEWIRRMVKLGYTLPGKRFGEFRPLAANGRVMFCLDGSHKGQMKAFKKGMTDAEYDEMFAAAPLPAGPIGRHLSAPDDHSLVVSRKTRNKEAAAKFVRYLTESKSALTQYHDACGFLPPVKNYREVAPGCFEDASRQGTLKYAVPNIVMPPYGPHYVDIAQEVMTAIQEIITTDKPVKQILDAYQPKIAEIIK
ncbi:MAG: sugar ABC transporter substrate-binding protein [Planctomycetota bacterium]|jgi:multiple sugar transport system substrate-binding protein|nr:sugar ABC transporter substrate-binding protein [Planctomycetota bacterium]